jgi:hypothetical protein
MNSAAGSSCLAFFHLMRELWEPNRRIKTPPVALLPAYR